MIVRVVFFILKLVREFLSDGELNTAWNREKIAMSQGFARYWVTLLLVSNKIVDHSDVVGALPVGTAPTTSLFST